jgi:hypothetical protein
MAKLSSTSLANASEIAALEASIVEHRARFDAVLGVAQKRVETFTRIGGLVDECRALKMPVYGDEAAEPAPEPTPEPKLNAIALPFQPRGGSAPATRAASPAARTPAPTPGARSPAASHGLPARPSSRSSSRYPARAALPQRPSGLRTVTGLEDGEVGEEDGEVKENGKRRAADEAGRNTRQRR